MGIGTEWLRMGLLAKQQREEQARADASRQQFRGLLGNEPIVETQPQAGPMLPGQERPDVTAQVAGTGTGLLGGQMSMPEFYAQAASIPGYEQLGMRGLMASMGGKGSESSPYDNVKQDGAGRWWGVRKDTGRVEMIPMQDSGFFDYKTVQSTDSRGMPITELVSPQLIGGVNPRITVGKKNTLPTEGESKSIAQSENAEKNLNELEKLVESKDAPDIGPSAELKRDAATLPVVGDLMQKMGYGMSTSDAKITSLTTALSNQLLAAMRGAQVGPEEQKKFEKQLPMPGQPRKLFMENLKATKRNLADITSRKAQLRGINTSTGKSVKDMSDAELRAIVNGD